MYARVRIEDDVIETQVGRAEPGNMGPPRPPPEPMDGYAFHPLAAPLNPGLRPSETCLLKWNDGAPVWTETATIDDLRLKKSTEMLIACRNHIEAGFICNALGDDFLYPAKAQDQANLIGSVTDSLLFADDPDWVTPFWCANNIGEWAFRIHTRSQIQTVGREGKVSILQAMQRNEILQEQILTADESQLPNITWSIE